MKEVHGHFLDASFDLSENGFGDGRQEKMYSACSKVASVVEISTSLLPVQFTRPPPPGPEEPVVEYKSGDMVYPTLVQVEGHENVQYQEKEKEIEPELQHSSSTASLEAPSGFGRVGRIKSSTSSSKSIAADFLLCFALFCFSFQAAH